MLRKCPSKRCPNPHKAIESPIIKADSGHTGGAPHTRGNPALTNAAPAPKINFRREKETDSISLEKFTVHNHCQMTNCNPEHIHSDTIDLGEAL